MPEIVDLPAPLPADRRTTQPDVSQLRAAALQRVREMQARQRREQIRWLRDLKEIVQVSALDPRVEANESRPRYRRSSSTKIRAVSMLAAARSA